MKQNDSKTIAENGVYVSNFKKDFAFFGKYKDKIGTKQ